MQWLTIIFAIEVRFDARVDSDHIPLSLTLKEGTIILEESDTEEDRNKEDKVSKEEELLYGIKIHRMLQ